LRVQRRSLTRVPHRRPVPSSNIKHSRRRRLQLALCAVLVDQTLETRVFAEWVPHGLELKHWDSEPVRDIEQMIKQAKCFVEFPGPRINLGERTGGLWPIKGVLGFGQQFDGALAFVDRFFFLTQGSKHNTQLSVSSGILRRFT